MSQARLPSDGGAVGERETPGAKARLYARLSAYRSNPFVRNVASISGGSIVGMGAAVAVLPVLTRLYTPEDFGALAAFLALFGPVMSVATFRLELALPLAKSDRSAVAVFAASILSIVAVSFACAVLIALGGEQIALWLEAPALGVWLWLLPAGVLLGGGYQLLTMWATREQEYKAIGYTKMTQALAMVSVQVVGGIVGGGAGGLISGEVLGRAWGSSSLLRRFVTPLRGIFGVTRAEIREAVSSHLDFIFYSTPSTIIALAVSNAVPIAFIKLYGLSVGGSYALATKILVVPAALIGRSVSQVFLKTGADEASANPQAFKKLYLKIGLRLGSLAVLAFSVVAVFGVFGFGFVFGDEWVLAGMFVAALAIGAGAQFVFSPLTQAAIILRRQGLHLAWDACRLAATVGVIAAASVYGWEPIMLAFAISGVMLVGYVIHSVGVLLCIR